MLATRMVLIPMAVMLPQTLVMATKMVTVPGMATEMVLVTPNSHIS